MPYGVGLTKRGENVSVIAKYRYTDKELKELLSSIVVLVDTREQENGHILDYLDKQKIPYKKKKLDYGDYGVYLPANPSLGVMRDMHFPIAIERKNSIDELIRSQRSGFMVLVEDAAGYENIIRGNYRSQYEAKALLASLKAFEARYGFQSVFISPSTTGNYIYHHFYYYIREILK